MAQAWGGYGAALLSATLGIKSLILAPQFTLNKDLAPWEKRWKDDSKNIPNFDSTLMTASGLASGYLFYDPFTELDSKQADLYRSRSNFIFVPVPFSGHATASMVNKMYSLKRLVIEILGGSFSISEFAKCRRDYGRKKDDTYLSTMYVYADARNREFLSNWCLDQIVSNSNVIGAKALRTLSIHEGHKKRLDRSQKWSSMAAKLTPLTASDCFIAAHVAAKGNYIEDAIRILEHGKTIAPKNISFAKEIDKLNNTYAAS